MKKDMIIFVCCLLVGATIESTGCFTLLWIVPLFIAVSLTAHKIAQELKIERAEEQERKSWSIYCGEEQLLDISTRKDLVC